MKILITGASGFVGGNLVKKLAENPQNKIRIFIRPNSNLTYLGNLDLQIVEGDLLDVSSTDRACQGIDVIFHCAAHFSLNDSEKEKFYLINIEGTKNICEAALKNNVKRIIYTSTAATVGFPGKGRVADENTPFNKWGIVNEYTRSKFLAEQKVLEYVKDKNLDAVIVNLVSPLGPGDIKPTPTGQFIQRYLARKIPYYMESTAHFIHIDDAVDGHIKAITRGVKGQRYLLGSENIKMSEVYKILEKVSDISSKKIIRIPYSVAYLGGLVFETLSFLLRRRIGIPLSVVKYIQKSSPYNFSKAVKELGISQTPIEKAFADSVNWFRDDFKKYQI